jgi:hypothetical protein
MWRNPRRPNKAAGQGNIAQAKLPLLAAIAISGAVGVDLNRKRHGVCGFGKAFS